MNLNDLAANMLQQQRSTPDLIAAALRQAILYGIFQGGQSLRQDEIATKFGVSRIPVREALRQLEAEGLVVFQPNRGATVTTVSPDEAQEIYDIRLALETMALQLAISQFTEANLQHLDDILAITDQTEEAGRWAELNWEFHAALYSPANRPRLLSLIKMLHTNVDRYVRMQLKDSNYRDRTQKEHQLLLNYCKKRDSEKAIALLQHHIRADGEQLVAYLSAIQ